MHSCPHYLALHIRYPQATPGIENKETYLYSTAVPLILLLLLAEVML